MTSYRTRIITHIILLALVFNLALVISSFTSSRKRRGASPGAVAASATAAGSASGLRGTEWITLFDGKTFNGWHEYNKASPVTNWHIEDGVIVCIDSAADTRGGDLVTDQKFSDFELVWDFKLDKGSNTGVMYHVEEGPSYYSPFESGPEYQVIDDTGYPGKLEEWQKTGADYAMYTPAADKILHGPGEWNSSRIVCGKKDIQYWLNGKKVTEFTPGSPDWNSRKTTGKWKDFPDYGKFRKGEIALQDHGSRVFFKNIRIRKI